MLSWTVNDGVIKELRKGGENIIFPWGIETADTLGFFSLEKNVGYRHTREEEEFFRKTRPLADPRPLSVCLKATGNSFSKIGWRVGRPSSERHPSLAWKIQRSWISLCASALGRNSSTRRKLQAIRFFIAPAMSTISIRCEQPA